MTSKKAPGDCARGICARRDRVKEANHEFSWMDRRRRIVIGGPVRGDGGIKKYKRAERTHPARDRGDPEK